MPHHHQSHHKGSDYPDLSETKAHIFIAGHELLKAAEGVLQFCRVYVEQTSKEKPHPNLISFFSKAIKVAGELGSSMMKGSPIQKATEKVMRPFCDTIEREMRVKKEAKKPRSPSTQLRAGKETRKRRRK